MRRPIIGDIDFCNFQSKTKIRALVFAVGCKKVADADNEAEEKVLIIITVLQVSKVGS
jgi:hypothetical protein